MKLDRTAFAVLDVETTGFVPGTHRIIEVAVVLVAPDRSLRVGLDTVLEVPGPLSAFEVHRIPATLSASAPTFEQVAGRVLRCLAGRVVVGHNLSFDLRHLAAELDRVGVTLPSVASVDTMWLDHALTGQGRRTLGAACAAHGIAREGSHAAGVDALATAQLLVRLLEVAQARGIDTLPRLLRALGGELRPVLPPSLAESLPDHPFQAVSRYGTLREGRRALQEYGQMLTVALADTSFSQAEADALRRFRSSRGLTTEQVRAMHAQVFAAAILLFCQDGRIDEAEVAYLQRLRSALSVAGWAPGEQARVPLGV